jgi:hypothetical protein
MAANFKCDFCGKKSDWATKFVTDKDKFNGEDIFITNELACICGTCVEKALPIVQKHRADTSTAIAPPPAPPMPPDEEI